MSTTGHGASARLGHQDAPDQWSAGSFGMDDTVNVEDEW